MITEHYTEEDLETTSTGLENACPAIYRTNALRLAGEVLEPLWVVLGPLKINSWFRSPAVNKAVGGANNSAHTEARAADIVPRGNVEKAFKMALTLLDELPIDQIIFEKRNDQWLHIAIAREGSVPRRMALIAEPDVNGRMVYRSYHE